MKKYFIFFIVILCGVRVLRAQTELDDSIFSGGIYRDYRLYIPDTYIAGEEVPLLLNLHGYSSNNLSQEFYGEFRPIADTANFIIVLPNGTYDPDFPIFRYWNCFTAAGSGGVDDVQFLSDLIDTLMNEYSIDANRIYSTGMSNGGFMSYALACELSERIAAVASVTGSISKARIGSCDPQHPTPVMEIHGTLDGTVPYNGSDIFLPIDSVVKYWVNVNNCNPEPEVIEVPDINMGDGCTATHFIYSGGDNNARVEHYRINNGGHTWPGTLITIGTTNKDMSASKEIWNFFSQYKLDILSDIKPIKEAEFSLKIFPNPFEEKFFIQQNAVYPVSNISIFDMNGRKIFYTEHNTPTKINTAGWTSGIYFVVAEVNGEIACGKVVKQ
ncbi:MAG: T9SS type A sorting domain-containing protein [Chitinophagales bacterium]|nr:T9SS type A sorting domain-containing protein [Chitinophagales bacterium]